MYINLELYIYFELYTLTKLLTTVRENIILLHYEFMIVNSMKNVQMFIGFCGLL